MFVFRIGEFVPGVSSKCVFLRVLLVVVHIFIILFFSYTVNIIWVVFYLFWDKKRPDSHRFDKIIQLLIKHANLVSIFLEFAAKWVFLC